MMPRNIPESSREKARQKEKPKNEMNPAGFEPETFSAPEATLQPTKPHGLAGLPGPQETLMRARATYNTPS